ncbi:MAG TPA: TonB family protein, partial [Candidatus Eisenbacteria bacterium]|nr:TonB family protein [Candidatus Eisenbacteria bacterium]
MTAAALHLDFELARQRTRKTMAVSLIVHALILFWITTIKSAVEDLPVVTEILMLEPGDLMTAAPSAPSVAPAPAQSQTVRGMSVQSPQDVHFQRLERQADVSLDPVSSTAFQDQLNSKLAQIQRDSKPLPVGTATGSVSALFGTSPATVGTPGGTGTAPVKLSRGGGGSGPALELSRGGTPGAPASLSAATVSGAGKSEASAPAKAGESTAQRTIAGASLAGPIADRPVLFYTLPTYPDWAKKEAVEGSVTLYFVVRPDGSVKENVLVQKTAGFGDFDENARTALRA